LVHIYEYPGAEDAKTYELENLAADPDHMLEREMERRAPFHGSVMLDIGTGSGFHALRYAEQAAHVYAVEPNPGMIRQFHSRFTANPRGNVSLLATHAEYIPLQGKSIDIAHARFAYFFGCYNDCDPGIAEAKRLLKPGGHLFIIDNYLGRGDFAGFLRMAYGRGTNLQRQNEEFYRTRGFETSIIDSCWRTSSREVLRRIIAMEFPETFVDPIMQRIHGTEISYSYSVYHYVKPQSEACQ
jgi:ubiquinone/menaquinone biosynthesis C-methylase UbiE